MVMEDSMKNAEQAATPSRVSTVVIVRDRLAYIFAKWARPLKHVLCGGVMAWAVVSACSFPTPLSQWAWLLALCVLGFSMIHLRLGAGVMVFICTMQMLSLAPELGWLTLFLGGLFIVACGPAGGRTCAVLATPYLLGVDLGIGVPLGLALSSSRQTSWLWGVFAFVWCAMHGFVTGAPRVGFSGMERVSEAMKTALSRQVVFDGAWLRDCIGMVKFDHLKDEILAYVIVPSNVIALLFQLLLWGGICYLMRHLYQRRRLKDRLAMQYLERLTRASSEPIEIPPHRRLPGVICIGALGFVLGYIVLSSLSHAVQYGMVAVVLDLVVAVLVGIPLYIVLEGDRKGGKQPAARRRQAHGAAFGDLPVGGLKDDARMKQRPPTVKPRRPRSRQATTGRRYIDDPDAPPPPGKVLSPSRPRSRPRPAAAGRELRKPPIEETIARVRSRVTDAGTATFAVETIVFIDMVGSTAMGSKFGDEYVLGLKEKMGQIVKDETRRHNVLFSKGTGDGFMLTFPEPVDAARAACGIMRGIREANKQYAEGRQIHLRFGIHMGQINIDSEGDRIGTAANFAARIEAAKPEQLQAAEDDPAEVSLPEMDRVFVSEVVYEDLKVIPGFTLRPIGYFEFKGITGLHQIFQLDIT